MAEIALIAAVARNGAIGLNNGLIFRESADQRHFRECTMGSPVIMGRKTWESLPQRFRPLPDRRNLVVSANARFQPAGAERVPDLDSALRLTSDSAQVWVIGGGQLYAAALPLAQRLELTEIDADLAGDVFFPPFDFERSGFERSASDVQHTAAGVPYRFVKYLRRSAS
jgi:dihydrofolate reductase